MYGTVAANAVLPIPINVCSIFVSPNNGSAMPLLGICNVHTYVDACDCTQELYGHHNTVCTGS